MVGAREGRDWVVGARAREGRDWVVRAGEGRDWVVGARGWVEAATEAAGWEGVLAAWGWAAGGGGIEARAVENEGLARVGAAGGGGDGARAVEHEGLDRVGAAGGWGDGVRAVEHEVLASVGAACMQQQSAVCSTISRRYSCLGRLEEAPAAE